MIENHTLVPVTFSQESCLLHRGKPEHNQTY